MSNIDLIRTITAELASRTKTQVTGWRWAEGVVVFPDIRCPYCKVGVRSPAIWKHTNTHVIGQVIPEEGVTPVLGHPHRTPHHAHVVTDSGGICFGRAKTAYQALFGALNSTPNYKHMVVPFLTGPLMGGHHCEEMDAVGKDMFTCYRCEGVYDEDDAGWFNDDQYCEDCFNEVAFNCWNCGETCSKDECNVGSDEYDYCETCWDTRFFKCEKCDDTYHKDDGCYDAPIGNCCEDCYTDNYFGCENCGDTTANNERAAYNEESICQTCFDVNFTECGDCDEVYANKDGHECEAKADDYDEDVLLKADDLIDILIDADGDAELLARIKVHTYQRYLDAPPMKDAK